MSEYIFKTNLPIRACRECPMAKWVRYGTKCRLREDAEAKYGTCPLVEVPPHARLINADNVSSEDIEFCSTIYRYFITTNSPTIIEAST